MITLAVYTELSSDATLTAMLAQYEGEPAIFTIDPAPGDAILPYIVAATIPAQMPFDTKNSLGRTVTLDVRCYTGATGSAVLVEDIAERVRALLHRQQLIFTDHTWLWSYCTGPISADETDAYGRIVTVNVTAEEV